MNEQINVQVKGVVLEDEKKEVNKQGRMETVRVILLHQKGNEKAIKISVPLDYKRSKKEGEEEVFSGIFYYGIVGESKLYGTLKVNM